MSCSVGCVCSGKWEVEAFWEIGFWDGGGEDVDMIREMDFWDDGGGEREWWTFGFSDKGGDEEGVKSSSTAYGDWPRDQSWVYLEAAKWGMCLWRYFLPPEMMHRLMSFIVGICDEGISHGSEFLGFLGRWSENRVFFCEELGFWGVLVIMVFWHLRGILKWRLKFSIERWHMGKARREVVLLSDVFSR